MNSNETALEALNTSKKLGEVISQLNSLQESLDYQESFLQKLGPLINNSLVDSADDEPQPTLCDLAQQIHEINQRVLETNRQLERVEL